MKYIIILLLLLSSLHTIAQDSTAVNTYCPILRVGENFEFGRRAIQFKEVVSDSRCPREVTCVWEGEAKVLIGLYQNGKLISEKILTVGAGTLPMEFSAEGVLFYITGMVLEPYPNVKRKEEELQYTLNLNLKEEISGS